MNSRGAILIVTIWILSILVVFVVGLGFRMSLDTRITGYNVKMFKLFYLTEAAINTLKSMLLTDEAAEYDSLNEGWSYSEESFKDIMLGNDSFTISYIREQGFQEKTFYGAVDEEAKININTIPREILLNLPGLTDEIADSIIDWRDEDDIPHEDGAEDVYYMALEHPYPCKDAPFQSREELLLVKGVTPEIFNDIIELITVYGEGKVNFNTANAAVFEALGLSESLAAEIVGYRAGSDEEEGTEDDNIFESLNDVTNPLDLEPAEATSLSNLGDAGVVGFTSRYFKAYVTAKSEDERVTKNVEVVVSSSVEEDKPEFWYEY